LGPCRPVVLYLIHNLKIEGSNPGPGRGREKNEKGQAGVVLSSWHSGGILDS
jgi:hypothetical protein